MDETEVCLLQWLERSGGLACLREQCSRYREAEKVGRLLHFPHSSVCALSPQPQAVYKLSLTLDPQDLGQYSGMSTGNCTHSTHSTVRLQRVW